ncbi:MAG TPA: hypothetical protein VFG69_03370 [Nannocystaceae bacterium]|nr:hypothetical protein [Nannocystaceae bacterium]
MDENRLERLEALLRIDERIGQLESARAEPKKPVWRNAALVAAYGSIIALVPALVTGVAGWLETRRELELAEHRAVNERTLAYLGLAVDPGATEAARAQVLRFLATLDGDPVGDWANAELARVEGKIDELETEKTEAAADLETTAAKAKTVQTQAAELQAQAKDDPGLAKAAAAKAAEAKHLDADVQRKREHVDALATRVGDAPLEILQMRAARRTRPEPSLDGALEPGDRGTMPLRTPP